MYAKVVCDKCDEEKPYANMIINIFAAGEREMFTAELTNFQKRN